MELWKIVFSTNNVELDIHRQKTPETLHAYLPLDAKTHAKWSRDLKIKHDVFRKEIEGEIVGLGEQVLVTISKACCIFKKNHEGDFISN